MTNHTPLSDRQAEQCVSEHGENTLTPPRGVSVWRLYARKYDDPIIKILIAAAAVSLGMSLFGGEIVETLGIIAAIFLATTVGFVFERDAARKFKMLSAVDDDTPVKVVRRDASGKQDIVKTVAKRFVAKGDIVIVEQGDEVPADGEILEATDLLVDESQLTGEPQAAKAPRRAGEGSGEGKKGSAYPPYRLLRSSMVTGGRAKFVVDATGDSTEIGKVARMAAEPADVKTPLNIQLDRLASLISKIGTAAAAAAFLIFLVHDILTDPLWQSSDYLGMATVVVRYFMMAVTLIVMAVPEGLPMAITLSLALNMRRMLKSGTLVRKLQASETMGAVDVVCTDKTGTLTKNSMEVEEMKIFSSKLLNESIAANTTAHLQPSSFSTIGNPTEGALLRYLRAQGANYVQLREACPQEACLPFSTERKLMATLSAGHVFVKGAPEKILSLCDIPEEQRNEAEHILKAWGRRAMRTLAIAEKASARLDLSGGFRLQALCAISDPLRSDVAKAVADCTKAGIEIKIVTGDATATASQIAQRLGIVSREKEDEQVVEAEVFSRMDDEEATEAARRIKVMSRARPSDKQRLVSMLQKSGAIVAVTGDGTNDAPALNKAHVGISLASGTSVAQQASDITLLDNSFATLAKAVGWGRSLYRNIQRFLFFQLVVNLTALLLVLAGSVIGTEMPLTVTQILWVNIIMDTLAALALASLPPSDDVMNDPPRRQDSPIITRRIMASIAAWAGVFTVVMTAYLYYLENNVAGESVTTHELTKFFTTFIFLQWWNLFNARTLMSSDRPWKGFLRARGFILVLIIVAVGQFVIVETGGDIFRTEHLSLREWATIVLSTMPVMLIGQLTSCLK